MTTPAPTSVTLRRITEEDHAPAAAVSVTSDQLQFVDPMPLTLKTTALRRDNFVIELDTGIAGFFQIDTRVPDYIQQPLLELCQVVIDEKYQGHGIGRRFIQCLPEALKLEYPDASGVVLTVNCRNKVAYHVYATSGFHDTGRIYTGGPSGPQHIMTMCWSGST